MQKYQLLKHHEGLEHGAKIRSGGYRWFTGPDVFLFRSTPVPGIHHYGGGPGQTSQRHHGQLREHYGSRTLRLRLAEWDTDYNRARVAIHWLDPWDNERQRPLIKNWKNQRRTQYRHPDIDRRIHAPACWETNFNAEVYP